MHAYDLSWFHFQKKVLCCYTIYGESLATPRGQISYWWH
jgi:hypothetical protein